MEPASFSVMMPPEPSRNISSLLVVRLSAMGDVLHALPAVAALRMALPDAHLGWVVEERWADLVRCAFVKAAEGRWPLVDHVHTLNLKAWRTGLGSYRTWREIAAAVRELRAHRYEMVVDFQGAARSALVSKLSGSASILGFAEPRENVASMFYTTAVLTKSMHVIEQNLELASAITGHVLAFPAIGLISDHGGPCFSAPQSASGYAVLNPGAGWGAKQWPAERYGQVAKCLFDHFQVASFINAGPGEDDLVRAAQSASQGSAHPVSCSPRQLIDLVKGARLFIGGDTGPTHLAAALGIPVVAIYGPTDPARTGPFGTRSIVLRNPASQTFGSHNNSPDPGMLGIQAEQVIAASIQLLREHCE